MKRSEAVRPPQGAERACRSELWLNPNSTWFAGRPRTLRCCCHHWKAANTSLNKVLRNEGKRTSRVPKPVGSEACRRLVFTTSLRRKPSKFHCSSGGAGGFGPRAHRPGLGAQPRP